MPEIVKPYTMDELRTAVEQGRIYKTEGIYLVNATTIAKSRCYRSSLFSTRHELEMGRRTFGVARVPEMYDAEELDNQNFLTMQLIEGRMMQELSGDELNRALDMRDIEIRKVIDLRIYPFDAFNPKNSILTQTGDVVLIDLEFWTQDFGINCSEMNEYKRMLGKRELVIGQH